MTAVGPSTSDMERLKQEPAAPTQSRVEDVRVSNLFLVRVACALFIAPNLLLAASFRPLPALVLAIGCALAFGLIWTSRGGERALLSSSVDVRGLSACLAAAIGILLLAGENHLFFPNWDWLIRDAVLSDLVRQGFPLFYRYEGQDYLMRAPLGMYLLPVSIGRIAGLKAAHGALLAQNSVLLGICLYFVAQMSNARNLVAFLLLFVLFSGVDALPQLAMHGLNLPEHLEWWNLLFQYSSHITQLFWVPNHALPGWWFAVLLLLFVRGEVHFAVLPAAFVTMLLWSPLAALGAAPFVALFALRSWRDMLSPRILAVAVAGLCFAPIAIYLTIDAVAVRHFWLIFVEGFVGIYILFIVIEIPHAAVVFFARSHLDRSDRILVVAAVAILLVIPFYWFGPSNDLAMRSSIVPLFLLAFGFAKVATSIPRDGKLLATVVSAVAILSAATPLLEVRRALVEPSFAISDCNFLTSWKKADPKTWPSNYLARIGATPSWLIEDNGARVAIEDRTCWPDHPRLADSEK